MPMSARAKGRRTITKAISFFRDKQMIVDEVELTGRFIKSKDLFSGLCIKCWKHECDHAQEQKFDGFDLIAMDGTNVWLVQVKTNKPPLQKPYIRFAMTFASKYIRVLAMTWYDRKGWVLHTFNKNGTVTKNDLRHKPNEKKNERK
jgi:hypothetical protein